MNKLTRQWYHYATTLLNLIMAVLSLFDDVCIRTRRIVIDDTFDYDL